MDSPSGFVFNSNNHPFRATGEGDNLSPASFPDERGIEGRVTNRALRAYSLRNAAERISREELLAVKSDLAYDGRSALVAAVRDVLSAGAAHLAALCRSSASLFCEGTAADRVGASSGAPAAGSIRIEAAYFGRFGINTV